MSTSPSRTILLIEDDITQVDLVRTFFERDGYHVISTDRGHLAVELLRQHHPDVIILDLTLPDIDGLDVAREIRRVSDTPIVFVTARTDEVDKIMGLEIGGDDYITKPFSFRELRARIRAISRRVVPSDPAPSKAHIGPYLIDWSRREVRNESGAQIVMTAKELELIWFLTIHPDVALTRERLFDEVWGSAAISSSRTLDVHIANLRKKLPELSIVTVRGTGYRLDLLSTPQTA